MQSIASGAVTGNPESKLVFINIWIGYLLKCLYTLAPNLPWYAWTLMAVQALGTAIWVTTFIASGKGEAWKKWIAITFIGSFGFFFQSNLQFFTTAATLVSAAMVLATYLMRLGHIKFGWHWGLVFIGLVIGYSVRRECMILGVILSSPTLIHFLWQQRHKWRSFALLSSALVALLLGLQGLQIFAHTRTPEWAYYSRFNIVRSQVQDNSSFTLTPLPQLDGRVGWSAADHKAVRGWLIDREVRFGLPAFEWYANALSQLKPQNNGLHKLLRVVETTIRANKYLWIVWVVIIFLLILYRPIKELLLVTAFTLALTLTAICVAGLSSWVKDRFVFSALLISGQGLFVLASSFDEVKVKKFQRWLQSAFSFALIIPLFLSVRSTTLNLNLKLQECLIDQAILVNTARNWPHKLAFFFSTDGYPILDNDPLQKRSLPEKLSNWPSVAFGTFAWCPYQKAMATKAGLFSQQPLLSQLINNNGYFIGTPIEAEILYNYLNQNKPTLQLHDRGSIAKYHYRAYQFTMTSQ